MASAEQRSRRRAQRETAKAVRQARQTGQKYQPRISRATRSAVRQGQINYAQRVLDGTEKEPAKGTPQSKELARVAGWSAAGKADPRFEAAFAKHWYHFKDDAKNEADVEDEADYDDEDYDDEDEE